jgi:hypothetical protein
MGELDDKMANFLSTRSALTAPGDFGNIQVFNSISKISYVRTNSSLDTAVQENTTVWLSNIYTIRPFNRYHSISSTYSSEDPEKPPVRPMVDENSAAGKQALMLRRTGFSQ